MKKIEYDWLKICFLIFFIGFAVFIFSNRESYFDPVKNTKSLSTPASQEVKEGKQHISYTFTAKNKKTRYVKLRLTEQTKLEDVTMELRDSSNKAAAFKEFPDQDAKTLTWQVEEKLTVGQNYYIVVSLPEGISLPVKDVKLKYHTFHTTVFYGTIFLAGIMVLLLIWDWYQKRKYRTEKPGRIQLHFLLYLILNGLVSYYILEFVFNNEELFQMQLYYALHNWLFCAIIYLILLVFFNSLKLSIIIGNIFFLIWALANQFVLLFKGQPIQPIDLLNIRTAGSVAKEYTYTLSWEMMTAIMLTGIIIFLTVRTKEQRILVLEGKKRWFYAACPVTGILLFAGGFLWIVNTSYISDMQIKVHLWRNQDTYNAYGIPMGFLATGKNMQVDEPENYSTKTVKELMASYIETAKNQGSDKQDKNNQTANPAETGIGESADQKSGIQKAEAQQPNIIAIMNESFADLSYINPNLKTNVPYLSFYNSLKENTIKGHLMVSPFGGWTANSEYEFLFGHSMELLGAAIPYSQYLNSTHDTLASNLKQIGYDTIAYHPHKPNNWRRAAVYPNIGFDQFISRDNMEIQDSDKIRNYLSDEADYEKLYEIMDQKEKGEKKFIFNVTLQNHGGYTYEGGNFEADVHIENGQFPEADQYLTLIKKSDEALQKLIEHFKNYDEPVVIVFFGDHFPNLPSSFYNWLYGKAERSLSLEEIQKKYSVPFFIWANYDIQEEENVITSTNYLSTKLVEVAGLDKTPYQEFLTQLRKSIPGVNINGYIDNNGIHHKLDENNEYTALLKNYNTIQYNELFDKKNKVKDFFRLEEQR